MNEGIAIALAVAALWKVVFWKRDVRRDSQVLAARYGSDPYDLTAAAVLNGVVVALLVLGSVGVMLL